MKGKFSKEHEQQVLYGRRSRKAGQICEIVGESADGNCYRVIWPGSKTPMTIHKSFIEIIN